MDLRGRRKSTNVEDRRGMSGATMAAGGGIGAVIIGIIMALFSGNGGNVDLGQVIGAVTGGGGSAQTTEYKPTPEEEALKEVCEQILGSTEDVWDKVFREYGLGTYKKPTLVFFSGSVSSACGNATAAVGPFYCSGDQKLYIDMSFFLEMKRQLGVEGSNFAYAYVIAHEIGHHVEYLTGSLNKAHSDMNRVSKAEANKISVRLELLADYYAGVWAHYENQQWKSLTDQDIEKALELAHAIGDDWLQKRAQGRVQPESFTHGTSEQRKRWLKRGYQTGDMKTSTFQIANYNDL
ncbi:MAG: neutral zinc metallopeptidase [Prevotella sp.]|nr:neutral zinc metallopeptidase [Prevotella sp.]